LLRSGDVHERLSLADSDSHQVGRGVDGLLSRWTVARRTNTKSPGLAGALPAPPVGLSAYRIVQQALTNTLSHGGSGVVRAGFVVILDRQEGLKVVGEAADGLQACQLDETLRPDVVLMDIRMPNMDGIEATKRITDPANDLDAKVLVLTTFGDEESVFESLRAGASGFLLKDVPPADLVQAVRVVASGESLLAPKITRGIIERFVAVRPTDVELQRRVATLSEREAEVLKIVGQGLTNAEIAEKLFLSEATVKSHVSHILSKLGARDRAQAVAIAYEAGLIQIGSLDA